MLYFYVENIIRNAKVGSSILLVSTNKINDLRYLSGILCQKSLLSFT
jgi:hypothetical protein